MLSLSGIWSISQITILRYTEHCIVLLKSKVRYHLIVHSSVVLKRGDEDDLVMGLGSGAVHITGSD